MVCKCMLLYASPPPPSMHCVLQGCLPSSLFQSQVGMPGLMGLQLLNLSSNLLTSSLPGAWGTCTGLAALDLSANQISGPIRLGGSVEATSIVIVGKGRRGPSLGAGLHVFVLLDELKMTCPPCMSAEPSTHTHTYMDLPINAIHHVSQFPHLLLSQS